MNEPQLGTIKNLVIKKEKLLGIIKENKAKHDAVFDAAVSGYWIAAASKIQEKRKQFNKYTGDLVSSFQANTANLLDRIEQYQSVEYCSRIHTDAYMDYTVDLRYPESHSAEYKKAIRSIELNIYDNISLSEEEFNRYVMNDWEWRASFITRNTMYVDTFRYSGIGDITGRYGSGIAVSGCSIF